MGWKEESQYRYRYTPDGRGEMAWQPTLVYKPDRSKNKYSSLDEMLDTLAFYVCVFMSVLAYGLLSHAEFMRHLDGWPRIILSTVAVVGAFVGTAALLQSKVVQTLIKLAVACSVAMLLWHLSYNN